MALILIPRTEISPLHLYVPCLLPLLRPCDLYQRTDRPPLSHAYDDQNRLVFLDWHYVSRWRQQCKELMHISREPEKGDRN
jgi:hypothetical protein